MFSFTAVSRLLAVFVAFLLLCQNAACAQAGDGIAESAPDVDIVDESLRVQQMNGMGTGLPMGIGTSPMQSGMSPQFQLQMQAGTVSPMQMAGGVPQLNGMAQMNMGQMGTLNHLQNMTVGGSMPCQSVAPNAMAPNAMMPNAMAPNAMMPNAMMPYQNGMACGHMGAPCAGMHCHGAMPNNSSPLGVDGQALQRAVGVVGAAAVLGVFLKNGGIGGALQSAGWDNRRHIRGPAVWQ